MYILNNIQLSFSNHYKKIKKKINNNLKNKSNKFKNKIIPEFLKLLNLTYLKNNKKNIH